MRLSSWRMRLAVLVALALASLAAGITQALASGGHQSPREAVTAPVLQVVSSPVRTPSPAGLIWLNPLPQGMNLSCVDFVDQHAGWAVGDGGTIMRTDDGGASWVQQVSGVAGQVSSVDFIDSATGWASAYDSQGAFDIATSRPSLLHTTNGGTTWQKVDVAHGLYGYIGSIAFTDAQHGVALCKLWNSPTSGPGAVVVANLLRATDGGATWSPQIVEPGNERLGGLDAVAFASAFRGWSVGMGDPGTGATGGRSGALIYRTDDGGATWNRLAAPPGVTDAESVSSPQPDVVWIIGQSPGKGAQLYQSVDAGMSWNLLSLPPNMVDATVNFASAASGWVTGTIVQDKWTLQACILHTSDGGVSWTTTTVPDLSGMGPVTHLPLACVGDSRAWCVGIGGFIARTLDAVTWERIGAPAGRTALPPRSLSTVKFTDATHGWAAGERGTIWRTQDGNAWQALSPPLLHYRDTDFHGETGYALGFDSAIQRYAVVKTTDGGATWRRVRTNQRRQVANDLFFFDVRRGWIVGSQSHAACMLVTSDGGATWRRIVLRSPGIYLYDINEVWFTDVHHAWAAAEKMIKSRTGTKILPTLVRTIDGGRTWWEVKSRGAGRIDALHLEFRGNQFGWASGKTGVWRTVNGGATWRLSRLWRPWMSGPVRFADATHGWALAYAPDWFEQRVFYTSDGGKRWRRVTLPNIGWADLAPVDAGSAYVVGGNRIVRVTAPTATP